MATYVVPTTCISSKAEQAEQALLAGNPKLALDLARQVLADAKRAKYVERLAEIQLAELANK